MAILSLSKATPKTLYTDFIMAQEVWGTLPKAQDDATTIDVAVAAAIAAHNDDPTAHMDDAQSLGVHRTNDIIDHPVGSVLADKTTQSEFEIWDSFVATTNWSKTNVTLGPGGYSFFLEHTVMALDAYASAEIPFFDDDNFKTLAKVLQFGATLQNIGTGREAYFEAGDSGVAGQQGIGVKWDATGVTFFVDCGDNRYYGTHVAQDNTTNHLYRINFQPADGKIYFYIDGVQKDSMDIPTDAPDSPGPHTFGLYSVGHATSAPAIILYDLYFSQALS